MKKYALKSALKPSALDEKLKAALISEMLVSSLILLKERELVPSLLADRAVSRLLAEKRL